MLIIVTEAMEAAMKRDLDALRDSLPENERELFEAERNIHRQEIINFFGENGYYPPIGGVSKNEQPAAGINSSANHKGLVAGGGSEPIAFTIEQPAAGE